MWQDPDGVWHYPCSDSQSTSEKHIVCEYGFNCPHHPNGNGCCSKHSQQLKDACDHYRRMYNAEHDL